MFDPREHICKFGFVLHDHTSCSAKSYSITCDLYQKSLMFTFDDTKKNEQENTIGFQLSEEKIKSLLPLLCWEEYELYRDQPAMWQWDIENGMCGYRDGWSYTFWCLSETGDSLLQINMECVFHLEKMPPYEKLLNWIKVNYQHAKSLKNKKIRW